MPPLMAQSRLLRLPLALSSRAFTTTPRRPSLKIPPESPRYIKLPTPPQSEERKRAPVRGHLPVPRDIFHGAKAQAKVSPGYLAKTAPEARGEARSETEAARRRAAASRRRNLAAGLEGLWARRRTRASRERATMEARAARNRAARRAPERADEALTRASVRWATAEATAVLPDPAAREKAAAAAARTRAVAQFRRETARDALAQLYVAAAGFIVDEAELEATVDRLFRADHFHRGARYAVGADNVWEAEGPPLTVRSMLANLTRTGSKLNDVHMDEAKRTADRQKILAETLTGGKIPA